MKRLLALFILFLPRLSGATSMDVDLQDCYIRSAAPTTNYNTTELIAAQVCADAQCTGANSRSRIMFGCKGFKDSLIAAGGYSNIVLDSLLLCVKVKRIYFAGCEDGFIDVSTKWMCRPTIYEGVATWNGWYGPDSTWYTSGGLKIGGGQNRTSGTNGNDNWGTTLTPAWNAEGLMLAGWHYVDVKLYGDSVTQGSWSPDMFLMMFTDGMPCGAYAATGDSLVLYSMNDATAANHPFLHAVWHQGSTTAPILVGKRNLGPRTANKHRDRRG